MYYFNNHINNIIYKIIYVIIKEQYILLFYLFKINK